MKFETSALIITIGVNLLVYDKHWFSHAFGMPNAFFIALFYNSHFHFLHELITAVKPEGPCGGQSEVSSGGSGRLYHRHFPDCLNMYSAAYKMDLGWAKKESK